jgi:hypothetical protein
MIWSKKPSHATAPLKCVNTCRKKSVNSSPRLISRYVGSVVRGANKILTQLSAFPCLHKTILTYSTISTKEHKKSPYLTPLYHKVFSLHTGTIFCLFQNLHHLKRCHAVSPQGLQTNTEASTTGKASLRHMLFKDFKSM